MMLFMGGDMLFSHEDMASRAEAAMTLTSSRRWLGTCEFLLPGTFAELRRVTAEQHLSTGLGYGCTEGS